MPRPSYLQPDEAGAIERRIAMVEATTGAQVIVALIGRCDRYPEIRWKAFALGVALSSLAIVVTDWVRPGWNGALLPAVVAILAIGVTNALLAEYLPAYSRLYVRHDRAEAETRRYAEALFLRRELFALPGRTAILIVLGLFERAVVVYPDTGFAGRVEPGDWARAVTVATPLLARGERRAAIERCLEALEGVLRDRGFAAMPGAGSSLPDVPIEERGP
jgi:uncharacterized membrane protein